MAAKLEDSNIALLGSKLDHELRLNSAEKEPAWQKAGKTEGTQVWRIEKFKVHDWPKEKYGEFFTGDAYIVLRTYKPNPKSDKLAWNAHFWLGRDSSQDEQGTAAYKTVELDEFLNGAPVQYREIQGYESETFKLLFPHLIYLQGGVDSGFNPTKPESYRPRLLHIQGDKHPRCYPSELSVQSLDDGDVYILDAGLRIWQWNGTKSTPEERRAADKIVHFIVEERFGKPKHSILDGLEEDSEFWKLLGESSGKPPKSIAVGTSKDKEKPQATETMLWRLSDNSGSLKLEKLASGKDVKKSLLNSDDVFFVDVGIQLFVYVGKKASPQEKANAINYATSYLKQQKRELNTPVARVIEGAETTAEFESAFTA